MRITSNKQIKNRPPIKKFLEYSSQLSQQHHFSILPCNVDTSTLCTKTTQMLIKFNFRFGWLWLPCISVGLFLVIYDAMSYIGAPFLYIHKIDYFFHVVLFSNFWKISDFPGKNCQFCEYKKSELQYNSWHHERPEKNLLASVGTITYRI